MPALRGGFVVHCFCGCEDFHAGHVDKTFEIDGKLYLVEGIPADVCERCGEPLFAHDVIERIRRMIRSPHEPKRTIQTEVLSYDAA
jgi:YgiT-type zinc finger domain-containing protein